MILRAAARSILTGLAQYLGLSIQDETQMPPSSDYLKKSDSISFTDMMTNKLANIVTLQFTLPIQGDSSRAQWLNAVADDFVCRRCKQLIKTAYGTGDAIIVPSWNGRNIQNILVGANDFMVVKKYGDEATAIIYVVDEFKNRDVTYTLLQHISLEPYYSDDGEKRYVNRYRLFTAKNGEPFGGQPGDLKDSWGGYDPDWYIPGVDRLLVGRMVSPGDDPQRPNPVKGIPICNGSSKPIAELHYLYDQLHVEFEQGESFIMADKRMFEDREDKSGKRRKTLPKGRNRVVMPVSSASRDIDAHGMVDKWSPEIRQEAYIDAVEKQYQLFEKSVGVSDGVLSHIDSSNYENVDNVRKSMRDTLAFVDGSRKLAEACIDNVIYAWDVLANYYEITPPGEYDPVYNWSDEYINTYADRMNGLINGASVGAVGPADIREYLFGEAPEVAREKVAEIANQQAAGAMAFAEDEGEAVTGGGDTMTSLNGAQITSVLSVIAQYKAGEIDKNQAIEITTTLGVSRDKAERMII